MGIRFSGNIHDPKGDGPPTYVYQPDNDYPSSVASYVRCERVDADGNVLYHFSDATIQPDGSWQSGNDYETLPQRYRFTVVMHENGPYATPSPYVYTQSFANPDNHALNDSIFGHLKSKVGWCKVDANPYTLNTYFAYGITPLHWHLATETSHYTNSPPTGHFQAKWSISPGDPDSDDETIAHYCGKWYGPPNITLSTATNKTLLFNNHTGWTTPNQINSVHLGDATTNHNYDRTWYGGHVQVYVQDNSKTPKELIPNSHVYVRSADDSELLATYDAPDGTVLIDWYVGAYRLRAGGGSAFEQGNIDIVFLEGQTLNRYMNLNPV